MHERMTTLPPRVRQRITLVPETDETRLYYSAADVFVCTSRVESYPRVILEAMAYGLPIVTTPVFGIREQVLPNVNGLFYEPGDVSGLAAALARVLGDRSLREKFANNARDVLATLTNFDEMVALYAETFIEAASAEAAGIPAVADAARQPPPDTCGTLERAAG